MLKLMGKKVFTILLINISISGSMDYILNETMIGYSLGAALSKLVLGLYL